MYAARGHAGFPHARGGAAFQHNGAAGEKKKMLCPKKIEKLYAVHFNQRRALNAIRPQDPMSDSPGAEMICGPVQQGRFIAHLGIQLSVATLIIDAALCDFEVGKKKVSICSMF